MTRLGSSILIRAPIEKVFARVSQHDRCADWLELVSSASYTSEQRVGAGTSAYYTGQIMGRAMRWEGRVVEWVESERIVWQASSGEPKRMKGSQLGEERGWQHTLWFRGGVRAALPPSRQAYGYYHGQKSRGKVHSKIS